ncbi:MAG: M48 family metalloprotease, partial [Planctomycetota bacterium]
MSDFYQRQDRARRGTWWLILLFILCTGGIVLMVSAVASGIVWTQFQHEMREGRYGSLGLVLLVALGTSMLILGGTVYKVIALRMGGGTMVAQQMGGHRVVPGSPDLVHRRLLNTVEEMAIASGVPVPPVYIMEQEQGINAFAAGYSPSDAVLGVTRGCAEKLTREELQGVIAHEFSHILNGDMRLSIRLIGILHGIILISLIGRVLMYSSGGRYNRRRGNAQLAIVGLVMFILGWV